MNTIETTASEPQDSLVLLIDELLSSGWTSKLDMSLLFNRHLRRVDTEGKADLDFYKELMYPEKGSKSGGVYTSLINASINKLVEVWTRVHRGEKGTANMRKRDAFIVSDRVGPKDIDKDNSRYSLREATLTYLKNGGSKSQRIGIYRYLQPGYSIKEDLDFYNKHLGVRQETKNRKKAIADVAYDIRDAERYGFEPDPEVIRIKTKALEIKREQEILIDDTRKAISQRQDIIKGLTRDKQSGWIDKISNNYLSAIYVSEGTLKDIDLAPLFHGFGSHLIYKKDYTKAISILQKGLNALGELQGSDDNKAKEKYALILQNLSALHTLTGSCELAEKEAFEALEIFRSLSNQDDSYSYGVAALLWSLAKIHVDMRKFDSVEEEYDEAASLFSMLSDEKPTEYLYMYVECVTSLAAYYYLIGKLDDSLEAYERAMPLLDKLAEKSFDNFAPQKVNAMINFAIALQEKEDIQRAEDLLNESIHITHVLNKKSPNVYDEELSTALQSLGALYGNTGQNEQARVVLMEAETIRRELAATDPGAFNGRLATTLDSLANLDCYSGNSNVAVSKWEEALSLLDIYDDRDSNDFVPNKGMYCFCIGLTEYNMGSKDKAIEFFSKAESLFRKVYDRNSAPKMFEDYFAMTLSYLGVLYGDIEGKQDEAESKFEESLDVALWFNSHASAPNNTFLLIVYCNYAPFLFNRGQYEDAKQMWENAVGFGDVEDTPNADSNNSPDLLDLAKQGILEAKCMIEHSDDFELEEDETSNSDGSEAPYSSEEALRALKSVAKQIRELNKDEIGYREKCIRLYQDSIKYCSSAPKSFFLADYLSSLCKFIGDSYIFGPIVEIAPIALDIFENALRKDNANMRIRLKYIELLSIYCKSLEEFRHFDKQVEVIGSALNLLVPVIIDSKDDIACTYAALKGEIMLDCFAESSPNDAYGVSSAMLNYYRKVSHPSKGCMCRLLTKAAIVSYENEKYDEAGSLLAEAEELMRDCNLDDLENRLCLGELYTFKGGFLNATQHQLDKAMDAFSLARQVLEGGVAFNPAAFKCKLLELYYNQLICMGARIPVDPKEKLNIEQLILQEMNEGGSLALVFLHSKEVLDICLRMMKLMEELTDLNEYVFSSRSVDAYLLIVQALQDIYFFDYYKYSLSLKDLEQQYQGWISMYSHMESMLAIYKKTDPSFYSDNISRIAASKNRLRERYRKAY